MDTNDPPNTFAHLLQRARAGEETAINDLHSRFSEPLRRFVRRHLDDRTRVAGCCDSLDLTQAIWLDLCTRALKQHDFASPEAFLAFLSQAARNKVNHQRRTYLDTQKRDPGRQVPLKPDVVDPRPTPPEMAEVEDEWQARLRRLGSRERAVLRWLRAGWSVSDIAAHLELEPRVIAALIRRCKGRLAG
jgi:RNA polymerase sigma factor (sigma-70 family)